MLDFNLLDRAIIQFDSVLRTIKPKSNALSSTLNSQPESLTDTDKQGSIRMMRINHSGEVCAQALYQGQAMFARNKAQFNALMQAAEEENVHLGWCKQRLQELNARTSLLNPVWYAGSFAIGMAAGMAGDKYSLGFLAETEYQVTAHLDKHLAQMSTDDHKSRAILLQMREDELQHATNAVSAGAHELPGAIKTLMRYTAKILTVTAARI